MKIKMAVFCVLGGVITSSVTFADADKKKSPKAMSALTVEQRKKMADVHEKMAACLRSDRPMSECHEEMMNACRENMGKGGCPMMGGKGMGYGHGHAHHHDNASNSD